MYLNSIYLWQDKHIPTHRWPGSTRIQHGIYIYLNTQTKDGRGGCPRLVDAPAHHICVVNCPHWSEILGANRKRQPAPLSEHRPQARIRPCPASSRVTNNQRDGHRLQHGYEARSILYRPAFLIRLPTITQQRPPSEVDLGPRSCSLLHHLQLVPGSTSRKSALQCFYYALRGGAGKVDERREGKPWFRIFT